MELFVPFGFILRTKIIKKPRSKDKVGSRFRFCAWKVATTCLEQVWIWYTNKSEIVGSKNIQWFWRWVSRKKTLSLAISLQEKHFCNFVNLYTILVEQAAKKFFFFDTNPFLLIGSCLIQKIFSFEKTKARKKNKVLPHTDSARKVFFSAGGNSPVWGSVQQYLKIVYLDTHT